jgi:hypothetical protein
VTIFHITLNFGHEITLLKNVSLNDLITLFIIYYTFEIINIIVKYINNYIQELKDNCDLYIRVN